MKKKRWIIGLVGGLAVCFLAGSGCRAKEETAADPMVGPGAAVSLIDKANENVEKAQSDAAASAQRASQQDQSQQ